MRNTRVSLMFCTLVIFYNLSGSVTVYLFLCTCSGGFVLVFICYMLIMYCIFSAFDYAHWKHSQAH